MKGMSLKGVLTGLTIGGAAISVVSSILGSKHQERQINDAAQKAVADALASKTESN